MYLVDGDNSLAKHTKLSNRRRNNSRRKRMPPAIAGGEGEALNPMPVPKYVTDRKSRHTCPSQRVSFVPQRWGRGNSPRKQDSSRVWRWRERGAARIHHGWCREWRRKTRAHGCGRERGIFSEEDAEDIPSQASKTTNK